MTLNTTTTRKIKYLNNRDLLAEIHRSKCSFSSFVKPEYNQYDIILPTLDKVNIRTVAEAKRNRAKRLGLQAFMAARTAGDKKIKLSECTPDYKTIAKTDVIIRIMTFEHIPLAPGRKKTTKTTADSHEKINFPPFQHYKFNEADVLECVGKSHWKRDLTKGKFDKDAGLEPLVWMQSGNAEMTQIHVSHLGLWNAPDFFALELPFLFDSHEHCARVLEGTVGENLLSDLEKNTPVKGLAFTYSGGYRLIAADKEIKTAEDLK